MYTRQQILNNRRRWAIFLQDPARKKHVNALEHPTNCEARCCLGHYAHMAGATRTQEDPHFSPKYDGDRHSLSNDLKEQLGLKDTDGDFNTNIEEEYQYGPSLAQINDETNLTPQQIGWLIQNVWLYGGPNTPFHPHTDYPG